MFSMMHSVKVTRKNSSDDSINHSQMTTYPQYPQYPQYFQYPQQMYYSLPPQSIASSSLYNYSDHDSRRSSLISQNSDQSLVKKSAPNMEDFLKSLDQEYGNNKFTCYLTVFEEQEILVSQLTRLSDSEYNSMGVTIIGRRQILRDEAKKYE